MAIQSFEDIRAWQEARVLAKMVYDVSASGSFARDFRLRDQIRGAAISVMANIAEGFDTTIDPDFTRFLGYARREASEVQSLLYVALDQAYITQDQFDAIYTKAIEVKKLIGGFIRYLTGNRIGVGSRPRT